MKQIKAEELARLQTKAATEKSSVYAETADEKDWKAEEDKKELEFVHDRLKQIE